MPIDIGQMEFRLYGTIHSFNLLNHLLNDVENVLENQCSETDRLNISESVHW